MFLIKKSGGGNMPIKVSFIIIPQTDWYNMYHMTIQVYAPIIAVLIYAVVLFISRKKHLFATNKISPNVESSDVLNSQNAMTKTWAWSSLATLIFVNIPYQVGSLSNIFIMLFRLNSLCYMFGRSIGRLLARRLWFYWRI